MEQRYSILHLQGKDTQKIHLLTFLYLKNYIKNTNHKINKLSCGEVDSGGIGGRITDSGSRWKFRREARVCKTFQEMKMF